MQCFVESKMHVQLMFGKSLNFWEGCRSSSYILKAKEISAWAESNMSWKNSKDHHFSSFVVETTLKLPPPPPRFPCTILMELLCFVVVFLSF